MDALAQAPTGALSPACIDQEKLAVTRLALQSAASIAGLMLTTEVMVAEAPTDEHAGSGTPGFGGMTGMDM